MSIYSPRPISDDEIITRFIFSPVHYSNKNGALKPAAFSHTETKGCSINRESIVKNDILKGFVQNSLKKAGTQWMGVVQAKVKSLREINIDGARAYCVYDMADEHNHAHSEIHMAYEIPEADRAQARAELYKAFNSDNVISPQQYRNGEIN